MLIQFGCSKNTNRENIRDHIGLLMNHVTLMDVNHPLRENCHQEAADAPVMS